MKSHYEMVDCIACMDSESGECELGCVNGRFQPCAYFCPHALAFPIARMVENGITIGKKRARLDLPDEPELVEHFADALEEIVSIELTMAPIVQEISDYTLKEFKRVVEVARSWARRGPLERLAEAGADI